MIKLMDSTESIRGVPMQIVDTHVASQRCAMFPPHAGQGFLESCKGANWKVGNGKWKVKGWNWRMMNRKYELECDE